MNVNIVFYKIETRICSNIPQIVVIRLKMKRNDEMGNGLFCGTFKVDSNFLFYFHMLIKVSEYEI